MTALVVEVISPALAPTGHTVMMQDPQEEEVEVVSEEDVAEAVARMAVAVTMLGVVGTPPMIKRLPRESHMAHTIQVPLKTIIRTCNMELLPLSILPEIMSRRITKVRLTAKFEHFKTISHKGANFVIRTCP